MAGLIKTVSIYNMNTDMDGWLHQINTNLHEYSY